MTICSYIYKNSSIDNIFKRTKVTIYDFYMYKLNFLYYRYLIFLIKYLSKKIININKSNKKIIFLSTKKISIFKKMIKKLRRK